MENKQKSVPAKVVDEIKAVEEKIMEVKDPNKAIKDLQTAGDRISDSTTAFIGSWTFIILFLVFFFLWIGANIYGWVNQWDPYPFILLNLTLSALAAIEAPIILMSQNRQADKDRIRSQIDYRVNTKAEQEVENMQRDLDEIKSMISELKNRS